MYSFQTVSDIRIEAGGASRLDAYLSDFCANKRLAVITDKGVRGLGLLDEALGALAQAGYDVLVFDEVIADPADYIALKGAEAVKAFKASMIVGFGGGSSMDSAKVIAHLAASDQPLESLYGVGQAKGPILPLVLVPTTAGTGSEVTNVAILTTGKTEKKGIVADSLYANRVLLDVNLTLGLPSSLTASTGIDAMVHAIEAYTSIIEKNPLSDALALSALRKLRPALERACENGDDKEARQDMLIGAMLAGQAFSNAPCAGIHALAYPLGGFFHVPHGLSNALVMNEVMKYNQINANHWYGEIATYLGIGQTGTHLIDEIYRLKEAVSVPQTLGAVGIKEQDVDMMAKDAMTKDRLLMNNARVLTHEAVCDIYRAIL